MLIFWQLRLMMLWLYLTGETCDRLEVPLRFVVAKLLSCTLLFIMWCPSTKIKKLTNYWFESQASNCECYKNWKKANVWRTSFTHIKCAPVFVTSKSTAKQPKFSWQISIWKMSIENFPDVQTFEKKTTSVATHCEEVTSNC